MSSSSPSKQSRQFSIASLLKWMTVVALLMAALVGGGSTAEVVAQFQTLPPSDQALQEWYEAQLDFTSIEIVREEQELTISFRYWIGKPPFISAMPPWEELGYSEPRLTLTSFRSTLFFLPVHLMVIGAIMFILFWLLERHARKTGSKT